MDFLVHSGPSAYERIAEALGARVIRGPDPRNPFAYTHGLRRILRELGPYDGIHSHVFYYSGWVLRAAASEGVPMRIAHSHHATSLRRGRPEVLRVPYVAFMRSLIRRYATARLSVSKQAELALFGRVGVSARLCCGIETEPFEQRSASADPEVKAHGGDDTFVIGHVGRLAPEKNHVFLLRVARELSSWCQPWRLLLVGSGPLQPKLRQEARALGVEDRVCWAGNRDDVPWLLTHAMDCFAFPSLTEALPRTLLEAQAAGLPCVVSDRVPEEVIVAPSLVRVLPLGDPREWARAITKARALDRSAARSIGFAAVKNSAFTIEHGVAQLLAVYESGLRQRRC